MQARWPPPKDRPHHWVSYAIVHKNWKLLANRDSTHTELYDIASDPLEKQDLTQWKPKVTQQLLKQIDTWKSTLPKEPSGNVFSIERKRTKR